MSQSAGSAPGASSPREPAPGSARAPASGPTPGAAAAPQRRHGAGTAADMLRSLLVIGVLVAVVFLAVPRPQGRIQQPVDVAGATEQARAAGLEVTEPDVPQDWQPNAARFAPDAVEGLPTWSVGYLLPDGTFAGVRATTGATPAWLGGVTSGASLDGAEPREVDGATWQRVVSEDGAQRRSLVLVEEPVTTVVTGTADDEALDALAAAVHQP